MQLCTSENNNPRGVVRLGNNTDGFDEKQIDLIEEFLRNNPILLKKPLENKASMEEDWDDYITNLFGIAEDGLLDNSEWFVCRVMETCNVIYSPEDIYVEEIKF